MSQSNLSSAYHTTAGLPVYSELLPLQTQKRKEGRKGEKGGGERVKRKGNVRKKLDFEFIAKMELSSDPK
jgi:hypothetical protein